MQERREEVRRLKALKMKELRHKLDKIGQEGGKNFDDDAGKTITTSYFHSIY